jgi:cellulose synthase/poly-beta-1,6-N-acetylglucosamine synthase-like glycosyltransferase
MMNQKEETASGISVILPAYNEERLIYQMIAETHAAVAGLGRDYEIVAVDDGSSDGTPAEMERAASDFDHVKTVMLAENQGKGNALNRGFQASRLDLVCFLDADLDLHPRQVENLLDVMERTGADVVIGSKRHAESSLDYPWYRKLFSTVYYFLILLLFRLPAKDTQTGLKLFRREVLARAFPRIVCKKYTLDLELLVVVSRLGYTIAEAPITLTFQGKFGRIGWAAIRNIITDTLAIFYRLHLLRYYAGEMLPTVAEEPRISVVIPAPALDSLFDRVVERCLELNYDNYDIVVVTGANEPNRMEDARLRFMHCDPCNNAAKRNFAAARCDSEVVAFIDPDAVPDIDWLRNAVPYFADESVAAVCGPAVPPGEGSRRQLAAGLAFSSFIVSGSTNYRYTRHAMRDVDDYPSFNFMVRREDFLNVGGYPEAFVPGEDTVLCLKLTREQGKRIVYVPNVLLFQHRQPLYLPHLRQTFRFARSRGSFVRKYPETSRRIHYFVPSMLLVLLVLGLGLSFASRYLLYAYLAGVGAYLVVAFFSSVKTLDVATNLLIFPGIVATNMVYGAGFLRGFASRRLEQYDLESGSREPA